MKNKHLMAFLQETTGRRLVIYGAGPAARELLSTLRLDLEYAVDDNRDIWGESIAGAPIRSPDALDEEPEGDRPLVIISSTLVGAISRKLEERGYRRGEDVVLSPTVLERHHEHAGDIHPRVLITSPSDDGGLFRVDLNDGSVERLMTGNCRGLAAAPDGYWLALEFSGILKLDTDFKEVGRIPYTENLNLHSLAYDPETARLYASETRKDRVAVYDGNTLKLITHFGLGATLEPARAMHHVNDIKLAGGDLLVSMFSADGALDHGVMSDGAVLRLDAATGERKGRVLGGLEQPHSILADFDGLWICNSMARTVQQGGHTAVHLLGYTRGLARRDEYFYIGQSQMRRQSRFRDRYDNISIDCGINIWDSETRTVRFLKMPFDNIYDLVIDPAEDA